MKINYLSLTNFNGPYAAMGKTHVEFAFEHIDKPIIQLYGRNRCGKTVIIQQLHPFSSISLNGDDRADLSLIIKGETGVKNIVYEVDGDIYNITHTYTPTRTSHTISSSIKCNGEELNPSGGVTVFNSIIEQRLGINKYIFQFIINGTQLTSFGAMSTTQRKNLLNKALGIDIYDKIHKLSTDDFRYTNKMLSSLSNSREYIIQPYGSYESMCITLAAKKAQHQQLAEKVADIKTRMDQLKGVISSINEQNPQQELVSVNNQMMTYRSVVETMGSYDPNMYDNLVQEQINLNNERNEYKNELTLINKDLDNVYEKQDQLRMSTATIEKAQLDYQNMLNMKESLLKEIDSIHMINVPTASSSYYKALISTAQIINDTCTEIVSSLNDNHLEMFITMIKNNIDIQAFLLKEGAVIQDSDKEMNAISRVKRTFESVVGDMNVECDKSECIYRKTYNTLEAFFKSYQSANSSQFTEMDLDSMEHANKNVMTLRRILSTDCVPELKDVFNLVNIMTNLQHHQPGIDVSILKDLMTDAANNERRINCLSQLENINKTIESMEAIVNSSNTPSASMDDLTCKINSLKERQISIKEKISEIDNKLNMNDHNRTLLSQVKHIDINILSARSNKLQKLVDQLNSANEQNSILSIEYNTASTELATVSNELKLVTDAYNQYTTTSNDIDKIKSSNQMYKIISDATSSTKGKPVLTIRDTVDDALMLTNRLLDIMYNGDIELLEPSIDESSFDLPFRCGTHTSADIRYGSQSESTLLSLALEMALSASLSQYNVCLVDEIDAYLDAAMHSSFLLMIQETMATLKMEQLFLISHSIQPGQFDHVVHTINLSE